MGSRYANSLLPSVTNPVARNFAANYVSARGIGFVHDSSSNAPFNNIRAQFMGNPTSSFATSSVSTQLPQSARVNTQSMQSSSFTISSGRNDNVGVADSIQSTSVRTQVPQSQSISVSTQEPAMRSNVTTQVPQSNNRTFSTPGVDEATEASESSSAEGAVGEAVPELALAQMAKDVGGGINNIWTNITNSAINSNYISTMTSGHGIGLVQDATNVAASSYANSSNSSLGGSIGAALGGPLGMLLGRGIAGLFNSPVQHAVAQSSTGEFNPQSGTSPQSQSSWTPSSAQVTEDPQEVDATQTDSIID